MVRGTAPVVWWLSVRAERAFELGRGSCWWAYPVDCTGNLPNSEIKRRMARLVLGWGTAREDLRGCCQLIWLRHSRLRRERTIALTYAA